MVKIAESVTATHRGTDHLAPGRRDPAVVHPARFPADVHQGHVAELIATFGRLLELLRAALVSPRHVTTVNEPSVLRDGIQATADHQGRGQAVGGAVGFVAATVDRRSGLAGFADRVEEQRRSLGHAHAIIDGSLPDRLGHILAGQVGELSDTQPLGGNGSLSHIFRSGMVRGRNLGTRGGRNNRRIRGRITGPNGQVGGCTLFGGQRVIERIGLIIARVMSQTDRFEVRTEFRRHVTFLSLKISADCSRILAA